MSDVHAFDQVDAQTRELHPGHTDAWYRAYIERLAWYITHDGDMEDAPVLPSEE